MFDIGAIELLLVGMVALVIIGPKDLPIAMRTAGRWLSQLRAMTGHFRIGIDAMIREAEIEEQEKVWAEKNAQVMRDHPPEGVPAEDPAMQPPDPQGPAAVAPPTEKAATEVSPGSGQPAPEEPDSGSAESKS